MLARMVETMNVLSQLITLILFLKSSYWITCTNPNATAYTLMEQHYSYVAHSDSDLIKILPGPISGDLYLIGTTV